MDFQFHVMQCKNDDQNFIEARDILNKVLVGETTRERCANGLCGLVDDYNLDLHDDHVMEGYKYWSGWNGYVILVGPKNWDGTVNRSRAIAQYAAEVRSTDLHNWPSAIPNDEYWEARLELARHWIAYLDKVIDAAK